MISSKPWPDACIKEMHSPHWLRAYTAHLGLLLPALDALWICQQHTPQTICNGLHRRLVAVYSTYDKRADNTGTAFICYYRMLDCSMLGNTRHIGIDIGKSTSWYCHYRHDDNKRLV